MNNEWIIEKLSEKVTLFAWSGNDDFIRRSHNFCVNWGLCSTGTKPREVGLNFKYITTSGVDAIEKALFEEGVALGMGEIKAKRRAKKYVTSRLVKREFAYLNNNGLESYSVSTKSGRNSKES
jgi:hypothetical protein